MLRIPQSDGKSLTDIQVVGDISYQRERGESKRLKCPRCGKERIFKDGFTDNGVQRYRCAECGKRFRAEYSKILSSKSIPNANCLIAQRQTQDTGDVDKKEILNQFKYYLEKEGLSESTINGQLRIISTLVNNRVNLLNPESVKEYLVSNDSSKGRKRNVVNAYKNYHKMLYSKEWIDAPRYKRVKKQQYLPDRETLIQIIAGVPNKYKPFCQVLMETGARSIELWKMKWEDINFKRKIVSINPAKNSNPRDIPISDVAVKMINYIPKETEYVFMKGRLKHFRDNFKLHLKKLAYELSKPEILKCTFSKFRNYYANYASYKYKDPFEVRYRMGHVRMNTTMGYVNRAECRSIEYVHKVCKSMDEECKAVEEGFEFIKDGEDYSLWRKVI